MRSDFRLGPWHIEPDTGRLRDGPKERQLTPRAMQVLLALADRSGEVVSREVLHQLVWQDQVVGEDVQRRAIAELRKALGDDASNPRFIETLPRRGYRLMAPIRGIDAGDQERAAEGKTARRPLAWLAAALAVTVLSLVAWTRTARIEPSADSLVDARGDVLPASSPNFRVVESPETRPLTTLAGRELQPTLSADGRRLAFALEGEEGRIDLWVQDLEADAPSRFSTGEAVEILPSFSPDGEHLAFVRLDRRGGEQRREVWIRPILGSGERLLALFDDPVIGLDFSPLGDSLALSISPSSEPAYLVVLSLSGEIRRLTFPPSTSIGDRAPSFSPSGDEVAFLRSALSSAQDIYRVPVEGGEARRLTELEGKIPGLVWAPSGFFFTRFPPGKFSLWRLDPGTLELEAMTLPARFPTQLAAGGQRLVVLDSGNDADIVSLPLKSPSAQVVDVARSTAWDAAPAYSELGEQLAFVSTRSGSAEIWLSGPEGESARRITRLDGPLAQNPRISPDGRRLAYDVRIGDRSEIRIHELAGDAVRRVGPRDASELQPVFSRDGRHLYYLSDRGGSWGLWRRPLAAAAERGGPADESLGERLLPGRCLVAEDPYGGDGPLEEGPEASGRVPLIVQCESSRGLRRSTSSGELRDWPEAPIPADWSLWAVEDEKVLAIVKRGSGLVLEELDRATGRRRVVAPIPGRPIAQGLAIGEDRVFFGLLRQREGDLRLVEGPIRGAG